MRSKLSPVRELTEWYERNARPLPWRQTRNPYRIWISEVMLQQTQVATVIPYYHAFLNEFPTVESLAYSEEASVLARWSGLGYYSRAKNLRKGAQFLTERHHGIFPQDRALLLEVPGIGPYTAGAILSIAFDLPEPLVDGNVQRVFSRYFGIDKPSQSSEAQKLFWQNAAELVKCADRPRSFNQALMELGATVCVKGSPRCSLCPIQSSCDALRTGRQDVLPPKKIAKKKIDLWWVSLVLESGGKFFVKKNQTGEWWADLWDFPRYEVKDRKQWLNQSPTTGEGPFGNFPKASDAVALQHQRQAVTHHRVHVAPFLVRVPKPRVPKGIEGTWLTHGELSAYPISSLVRKVLGSLDAT